MDIKKKQKIDRSLGFVSLLVLRLPVILLGRLLRRDHSPVARGDILFIKMQGGGSLVIAFPAIVSIRKRYKGRRLVLLTTPSVAPFGESLGVFDEIICIDDRNLPSMFTSMVRAWFRCFRVDTVVDMEVYSKLTTVFSVLTAARNRIGFYLESVFWRRRIHTHLIFFNRFAGSYHFYEQVAKLMDAPLVAMEECSEMFLKRFDAPPEDRVARKISIGHACSEMGRERMLTAEQWCAVFTRKDVTCEEFVFLGTRADYHQAQKIIEKLAVHFPEASFNNECGSMSLAESISCLNSSDEFWGIDSALLHYARLLGKKTVSFWGPTDPMTRLKNYPNVTAEVYYKKVPCSPCIHVAEEPPCYGDNICIKATFEKEYAKKVEEVIKIMDL